HGERGRPRGVTRRGRGRWRQLGRARAVVGSIVVADTVPNPLIAVRLLDVSATRALTDAARRRADRVASLLLEQSPMCRAAQVGGSFAKDTARQNTHSVDLFVAMSQRGLLTRRGRSYKPSTVVRQLYEVLSDAFEGHIQRGTVRLRRRTR